MINLRGREQFITVLMASSALSLWSAPLFAQTSLRDAVSNGERVAEVEDIVVTGSRIKRDAFNSTSPVQVLSAETAKDLGLNTVGDLLGTSTALAGQQLDASFGGSSEGNTQAPPAGGFGSTNISLRGLGPERTLVLVNGRRMGSTGVRGAPSQPDISLLPVGMVSSIDILTGGLSTVYGADAVAGVVNVKLREDFEGFEITGSSEHPGDGGGQAYRISGIVGAKSDRAAISVGVDFYHRKRIAAGQRSYSRCARSIEATQDRSKLLSVCRDGFWDNAIFTGGNFVTPAVPGAVLPSTGGIALPAIDASFLFYTPGQSDIGIPNFSTAYVLPQSTDPLVNPFPSSDGGRFRAVDRKSFTDFYSEQDERRNADLVSPQKSFSAVASGHYDFDWGNNERVYFEAYYFNRQNTVTKPNDQIYIDVPALIPREGSNGNFLVDGAGNPLLFDNPLSPFPTNVAAIYTLEDLPQRFDVEAQQFRGVLGFKGDIGGGWFGKNNWSYDAFFAYDRGIGFQSQPVLLENNALLASQTLRFDANGNLVCGIRVVANNNGFLTPEACVPVNFFATSLFTGGSTGEGVFATDAERDYLIGRRINRTVTQQYNAALNVNGSLFEIGSANRPVGIALGAEWRKDQISSQNDIVGTRGAVGSAAPQQEGETIGSRYIYDLYGEISVPVIEGRPGIDVLQFDGSLRYTREQFFGSQFTYRLAGLYRPVEFITISGSYNTSFRAPNLREQFLASQQGAISGFADPCANRNFVQLDPASPDTQRLFANCIASGANPNVLGTGVVPGITTQLGGAGNLRAETSRSWTATVQFSQPFSNRFKWDVVATYFNIDVSNTVTEIPAETILSRCFTEAENLASPFCQRLTRRSASNPAVAPADNFVNFVDASFVNVGRETSRGIDVTSRFLIDFEMGEKQLNLGWIATATRQLESSSQIFASTPAIDNAGRIGTPKWVFQSTASANVEPFTLLWRARYLSGTRYRPDVLDPQEGYVNNPDFVGADLTSDVDWAGSRLYHDLSIAADLKAFRITAGIKNLLNTQPPLIDGSSGPNINNAVTGSGYDLVGRTFFLNGTFKF